MTVTNGVLNTPEVPDGPESTVMVATFAAALAMVEPPEPLPEEPEPDEPEPEEPELPVDEEPPPVSVVREPVVSV